MRKLSELAFTADLASDIYFAIGSEAMKVEGDNQQEEAMNAFATANKFSCSQGISGDDAVSWPECRGHGKSLISLARLALTFQEDAKEAQRYAELSLKSEIDDDAKIEAHVIAGRAKMMSGSDIKGAISEFRSALDLHVGEATGEAHYHLALALQATEAEPHAIANHFEQALNLGKELTIEAIDFLGEENVAVRRSANRQQWAEYERAQAAATQQRGGIMGGGGSSLDNDGSSVFASQQQAEHGASVGEGGPSQLDMLAEGAAAYDGKAVPDGEDAEGLSPSLSGQGSASSRARLAT